MAFVVRFLPEDRRWAGDSPVPLSLAAAASDIFVEQPCGSRASCGRCRVRVVEADPALPADAVDRRVLGDAAAADGWRLGCRLVLRGDATVEVPPASRVVAHKTFGADDVVPAGFDPVASAGLGIALDVGSTTLAAAVVEMATGAVRGVASALNPQVRYGADIMSRIAFARRLPHGDAELRRLLMAAVAELVARALAAAGAAGPTGDEGAPDGAADVVALAVVGNPTMLHVFQGLPVRPLGEAPFQGERYGPWTGAAASLGIALPKAEAFILPGIRAHVGADAVAAVVATGLDRLDRAEGPRLLMDLGTNTEIVLATDHGLFCTSAASGPAFEGGSLRHGMRAAPGAIDQVRVDADGGVLVRTIEDAPAVGLCGSGVVDALAELLRIGLVDPSGRLLSVSAAAERQPISPLLARRVVDAGLDADGERAVRLTDGPRPVLLTATDVREVQLVKGSIGAAVALLLKEAGLRPEALEEVLLAGAFGSYVRGGSALALGLIPPIPPERIRFVGNAAGAGARLALVDRGARERAARVARDARFVELAGRPEYEDEFVSALRFPEPEPVA